MIFNNGFIEAKITTGGGIIDGIPEPVTSSWGEPISCHIVSNQNNNRGVYSDGNYKNVAFTVWLDTDEPLFESKRVRLTTDKCKCLGEFDIQSIEHFNLTKRTRITV